MILILIGYMGSGKSTIGRALAKKLGYDFLDLDDYIELKENKTIPEIFKSKGEIYFRKAETFYLTELLSSKQNLVLSLGGGTPCYGNNMGVVLNAKHAQSVYLKASIPTLVGRLKQEKQTRPLIAHLKTDEQLTEFIGKHLFERSPFYAQAHKTIITDGKAQTELVNEIKQEILI
ncbi:MAG: shikimate kinase [Flavobacteriaceae bacterium]